MAGGKKGSYSLKQTQSFCLQVSFSMSDFKLLSIMVKEFFLWEFFIKKVEIYFVLKNTGCHDLEVVPQTCCKTLLAFISISSLSQALLPCRQHKLTKFLTFILANHVLVNHKKSLIH